MKKLFFFLVMALLGIQAHAALIITNNSNCTIRVRVLAHDASNTGFCALRSKVIVITAGNFEVIPNVLSLNATPGWEGGATAVLTGSTWDGVEYNGVTNMTIGFPGTCAISTSASAEDLCGADVSAFIYTISSNTVADFVQ